MSTLGAQSLEQILGTSLMNMVPTEERKACQGLLDRAMGGQRGSFEVDLVGLTGSRHTFELRASAHPGAPDGSPRCSSRSGTSPNPAGWNNRWSRRPPGKPSRKRRTRPSASG